MLQPQFGRGDLADNVHMLVVLVLFVVDVTCLEGSGPRLRSAQVGLLDFHVVAELFVCLLCVQVLSDSFNQSRCLLLDFVCSWLILVQVPLYPSLEEKKCASTRGKCSIPCGTCGPQGVVGAVFLVELVGFKAWKVQYFLWNLWG